MAQLRIETCLRVGADRWRSEEPFSANGDPDTIESACGILNASIGVSDAGGRLEIRGFVRKVLDEQYVNLLAPNPADTSGGYVQYDSRYQERQAGVTVRVAWDGAR